MLRRPRRAAAALVVLGRLAHRRPPPPPRTRRCRADPMRVRQEGRRRGVHRSEGTPPGLVLRSTWRAASAWSPCVRNIL
eukprot:scaffold250_cov390-Prasinococcus_capsulatus_cf.AAC.1